METNKENITEVQGTEVKKQKISATYVMRAFGQNAEKLMELGLIDKAEHEIIKKIRTKALTRYVGE